MKEKQSRRRKRKNLCKKHRELTLEITNLDETVEKDEVVPPVIQLAESDAERLLHLEKLRIGCVKCRIREHAEVTRCFRCLWCGHRSRGYGNPDRKDAC